MDLNQGLADLVAVALVAALAPLVVAVLPGPRIPQVVILLLGGVLIGPHVLGVAETTNIQLLANIGLGFLFLLAGYELDPGLLRQRPGTLAILGWLISAVLAVGVTAGLGAAGYVRDYVPVGLALTTTALGTLLPILRDHEMLSGPFGQYVYAAGAAGELFPILIIAVFLTGRGNFIALASVALVGALALVEIGQRDGVMLPANVAALVGAGVLSVLVYPLIAVILHRSAPLTPADVGITAAEAAAAAGAPPDNPGQPASQDG